MQRIYEVLQLLEQRSIGGVFLFLRRKTERFCRITLFWVFWILKWKIGLCLKTSLAEWSLYTWEMHPMDVAYFPRAVCKHILDADPCFTAEFRKPLRFFL